ncbi:MAG: hypothetical protein II953_09785 [Clostridia bacterium]|jgi:pyruvate dehydrogenase E2 component (dihydrolipoamide acetyltransferase)/2-oxoglutarate dehydrogenase E2 component (dihydrolipoamide succinyltransferase)|nr:hypothetical protein [Clostridia bacterium]MBQ3859747.1 hypothetical protein [Clostridia bacterium]
MKIELKMPALRPDDDALSVLCQWNVKPGDVIPAGDVLFEVETAKVVSQIEAETRLRILSLCAEEGDEVAPGTVIAIAETVEDEDPAPETEGT